jgi:pimeloyl-ACP methyl ester carboxylesterase
MSATERTVTLADGRTLAVWEGGDPTGRAVVYHHGTPMAGLLYEPHVRDAAERGIRLVGYSRPGYGVSAPAPGRTIASAAADTAALADALGIDRFATWGISGGGPHALACAALLPERVVAAASLAGVIPFDGGLDAFTAGMGEDNVLEFGTALRGREELRALLEPQARTLLELGAHAFRELFASLLSPVDREVLTGELAAYMHRVDVVALERGVDGWLDDDIAFTTPWGFRLEQIAVPTLVWQGHEDRMVPRAHGEWLAARIPGAEARIAPADGHLTLIERRVPEVHAWLLQRFA